MKTATATPVMKQRMFTSKLIKNCVLPFALVSLYVHGAQASTIILSDNFTGVSSAQLNANGWYFTNSNAAGTPWSVVTDNTSPLSGNVMSNPGSSTRNTQAYKQFSTTTLAGIGDSITIKLDFHTTTAATDFFSVGLLSSANTFTGNIIGSGTNPAADADGYGTWQAFSSSPTALSYRGILNNSYSGDVLYTTSQLNKLNDNLGHSYMFSITRVATGLRLDSWIDGNALDSFTVTNPAYNSFNTLKLLAPVNTTFNVDNIVLSTVPEPSVFGLLAVFAVMGIFSPRRRSRVQA
jgi:hypothetical protein